MIRFNKDVTLGTVLQIAGYIVMVIYFTAQIQGNIISLRSEIGEIKAQMHYLQTRVDAHIDKHK